MADKAKTVHLVVVTPYSKFYEDEVDFVVLPTSEGEHGILPNHSPIVAAIYPGSLRIRKDGSWQYAFVSNGYVQVGEDYTILICNAAEWAKDIDPERAKANLEKNEKRLLEVDPQDLINRSRYKHAIRRNKNRLKVAARYGKQELQ